MYNLTFKEELYSDTETYLSVLLLNDKIVITHFESQTRQLFETEEGSFVYYKDIHKLHKVTEESYTKALIRLTILEEEQRIEIERANNYKTLYE